MRVDGFKPPFSNGKDVMILTAMAFELDKNTTGAVANLSGMDIMGIAFEDVGRGRSEGMSTFERIDAFAYLIVFLATVAGPVHDPRGVRAMQCLQPLKGSLEGAATLVRELSLRKRKMAG